MPVYTFNQGKINDIDMSDNSMVLTIEGNKIRIRMQGESTPYIECLLDDCINHAGAAFATMAAFITYWNTYYTVGDSSNTEILTKLDVMSSSNGEKIVTGIGPHPVHCRGFVSRIDDCVIASITVNAIVYTGAALEPFFPNGNKFYKTEMFLFAETEVCSSITMTLATDSINTIKV